MVKLSELRSAEEIHEQDMRDLDYRREHERTRLANDVAIKVIRYRVDHGLTQAALARRPLIAPFFPATRSIATEESIPATGCPPSVVSL